MSDKHKPCPFCGEEENLTYTEQRNCGTGVFKIWIECLNCGARGQENFANAEPGTMIRLAWAGWNERV